MIQRCKGQTDSELLALRQKCAVLAGIRISMHRRPRRAAHRDGWLTECMTYSELSAVGGPVYRPSTSVSSSNRSAFSSTASNAAKPSLSLKGLAAPCSRQFGNERQCERQHETSKRGWLLPASIGKLIGSLKGNGRQAKGKLKL